MIALVPDIRGLETRVDGANASLLLIHGLFSFPEEMETLALFLNKHGFSTFIPQLAGHGTAPEDLARTKYEDLYDMVISAFNYIKSWHSKFLFVVGFSLGGALAIRLAVDRSEFDGLVLIAPMIKIRSSMIKLIPLLKHLVKYKSVDLEENQRTHGYDIPRRRYDREPLSAIHEAYRITKDIQHYISRVDVPVCVIQGTADKTINPESVYLAFDKFGSTDKELHRIENAPHVIPCHPSRDEAYSLILDFIKRIMNTY